MEPKQIRALFYYDSIENNWLGHIMSEVYKDRTYQKYLPLQKEGTIALDVGAHIGIVSLYLSKYFEQVISIEPSKEHFECLSRNIVSNNATNITMYNKALYIKDGKFPFGGQHNNLTTRSLHTATWQDGKNDEIVDTMTIEQLFEKEKLEKVDFMKLDIEGSEVEIISSAGFKRVAPKIEVIMGEYHHFSGRHPNQFKEAFKNAGFDYEVVQKLSLSDLFVAKRK